MILTTGQRLKLISRHRLIGAFVVFLLGLLGLALTWVTIFYPTYAAANDLLIHGVHIAARVTELKPENHNEVTYIYQVGRDTYKGDGPADGPDGSASQLSPGQSIHVVYSSLNPAVSCDCDVSAEAASAREGLLIPALLTIVWMLAVSLWTLFGDGWSVSFVERAGTRWVRRAGPPPSAR